MSLKFRSSQSARKVTLSCLCCFALQATNVFTFSDIVKTTYVAVKINIAADGGVTADTTDKKFATTTFKTYPIKSFLVALNYGSAATCTPLTAPGTGARLAAIIVDAVHAALDTESMHGSVLFPSHPVRCFSVL
jgi:hypothetical protein